MSDLLQTYTIVSWRMTGVIGAWMLLRLALRGRVPARIFAFGWVIIIAGLLLPWRWPTVLSPFNWLPRTTIAPQMELTGTPAESFTRSQPFSALKPSGTHTAADSARSATPPIPVRTGPTTPTARFFAWRPWCFYTWLGGALALVGIRLGRQVQGVRAVARQQPGASRALTDLVAECARELSCSVPIRVHETTAANTPSIWGIRGPVLLFPKGFAGLLTGAELRLVILHELGHWCRRDLWMHELTHLVRALHWFNPLVWMAARLSRDDCEAACDEFVMRRMSSREIQAYGATLLKVLGVVRGQTGCPIGLGIFDNKQKLQSRIQMIAQYQRPGAWRTLIGAAAIAALLAVSVTQELYAQAAPVVAPAGGITTVAPAGWWRNGQNAENYTVGVDGTQPHLRSSSAYVRSNGPGKTVDFGGMMQTFDAAQYLGKRLRFSAWMKTQDADNGAQLWMRVDGPSKGQSLQFDNMDRRPHPTGTIGWQHCEVVLDVPAEATAIAFGFFLKQTGQAWVNDARLEVVDSSVPVTDMKTMLPKRLPPKPSNLEFEAAQ